MRTSWIHSFGTHQLGRKGTAHVRTPLSRHTNKSLTAIVLFFAHSLKAHGLVSDLAGEIWYASSVLGALMLFGLAVFFFVFGALPYWFKLHKHLSEILGCTSSYISSSIHCSSRFTFRLGTHLPERRLDLVYQEVRRHF